jgi:hypothetical protein
MDTIGRRTRAMASVPRTPSQPTMRSGAMPIPASDIKWSSNVSWAACTACDAMMSPMPTTISAGGTGRVREPSPERTDAAPTAAMPAAQHAMPRACRRLRVRPRKVTAKMAAKSISAPRIIW